MVDLVLSNDPPWRLRVLLVLGSLPAAWPSTPQ